MRMTTMAAWVVISGAIPMCGSAQDGNGQGPPHAKAPIKAAVPKPAASPKVLTQHSASHIVGTGVHR
jgi:hypothetical protein